MTNVNDRSSKSRRPTPDPEMLVASQISKPNISRSRDRAADEALLDVAGRSDWRPTCLYWPGCVAAAQVRPTS